MTDREIVTLYTLAHKCDFNIDLLSDEEVVLFTDLWAKLVLTNGDGQKILRMCREPMPVRYVVAMVALIGGALLISIVGQPYLYRLDLMLRALL